MQILWNHMYPMPPPIFRKQVFQDSDRKCLSCSNGNSRISIMMNDTIEDNSITLLPRSPGHCNLFDHRTGYTLGLKVLVQASSGKFPHPKPVIPSTPEPSPNSIPASSDAWALTTEDDFANFSPIFPFSSFPALRSVNHSVFFDSLEIGTRFC